MKKFYLCEVNDMSGKKSFNVFVLIKNVSSTETADNMSSHLSTTAGPAYSAAARGKANAWQMVCRQILMHSMINS